MIRVSRTVLCPVRPEKRVFMSMKPWTELKKSWKWSSRWSLRWFLSTSQGCTAPDQIFQGVFLDSKLLHCIINLYLVAICLTQWLKFQSVPSFLEIWQVAILESSALNSLSNEQSYASVELLTSRHSHSASLKSRSSWWFCFNLKIKFSNNGS